LGWARFSILPHEIQAQFLAHPKRIVSDEMAEKPSTIANPPGPSSNSAQLHRAANNSSCSVTSTEGTRGKQFVVRA
jgi:hypothetical protein